MTDSQLTEKTQVTAADVRAWARARGLAVGKRGHLPLELIDRFNRQHRTKEFTNNNPWAQG